MEANKTGTDNRIIIFALVVALVALLQYVKSYKNEFVWDSVAMFSADPSLREVAYLPDYFLESYQAHYPIGLRPALQYYRPLIKIFHVIEYQAFGQNPIGYNSVNIVLNAAVVVLAFLFINAVTGNTNAAFLAALLYAVNPTRVEAVSWAYSDSYIFMAFFSFLSLLLYQKKRYLLSTLAFAFSLFCHESAILLPVIVVLYECCIPGEKAPRPWIRTAPFFALTGLFLLLRRAVVGAVPLTDLSPFTLFNTVLVIIKRYVKIFFIPDAPVTIYQLELFPRMTAEVAVSYAVALGLVIFGVFLWRKKREYLFWYLWFFVWISVNFNVGRFADGLMGEKLLNTASFGFCALLALFAINVKRWKIVAIALISALVLFHFLTTFNRTRYWKDNITYFEKALEFNPTSIPALIELGNAYVEEGEQDKAILLCERVIAIAPRLSLPYLTQGRAYGRKGDLDRAMKALAMSIQLDPSNPRPYYYMGVAMERRGDLKLALQYYRQHLALAQDPSSPVIGKVKKVEEKIKRNNKFKALGSPIGARQVFGKVFCSRTQWLGVMA